MARDWDKLAGEKGRDVDSSRLGRLMKVGRLGASMTASTVARRVGRLLPGGRPGGQDGDSLFRSEQAQKVLKVLGELKGATMKVGQILSSDPDLVPPEFMEALTRLQHAAPPMTWRQVKEVLEAAFDQPLEAVFRTFDPEPLGSASIGQVHRATLKTGEDVAVKVQYPGIADTLESDMRNLGTFLGFGRVMVDKRRLDEWIHEVRQAVLQESDYLAEGRRLARFHRLYEGREGVRVPRPFEEWTRENVLTMAYVEGRKLDEALLEMPHGPRRDGLLLRWVTNYAWMFHEHFELHADPHPGNFLLTADDTLVMLDFGCVKRCDPTFADGILDILDALWQGDHPRAASHYRRLGFGREGAPDELFEPELLRQHHEIVLAPFLRDVDFDFGRWEVRAELQRFIMKHPAFLKLVPPAEGLLVFRVMGGIKGLLNKLDATLNVHRMAVETARRRGRLTAEPTCA